MSSMIKLWLSPNQLFNLLFFLCFLQIFTCIPGQFCTQEQNSALLKFRRYFSFNKDASACCDYGGIPSHPKLESWKEGSDCCSWEGVKCENETGQVIELDLSCSWLQGTIHPNSSLARYFPRLQSLNLACNDFGNSQISPNLIWFPRMTHLNLSYSWFSGKVPTEVSFLTQLVSLDLSKNNLTFEKHDFQLLSRNLSKMRELELNLIDLSSVDLNSLLNLTSLTSLRLNGCGLHGKFPDGIFQLPHLQELHIGVNLGLTSSFPKFINSTGPLHSLHLSFTNFSGELPDSIGNLKSLKEFVAILCQFYGSIPMSLGNLTKMTLLDLSGNNFTGTLPSSLSNLENLCVLSLRYNYFQGPIVDVLPSSKNLASLYLDSNNFNGSFPSLVTNLTGLLQIDMSNNHLTGPLPSQQIELQNLTMLRLSRNFINGTIPSWVYGLPALNYLDLSYNKLTSHINEFQSTLLEVIDLSYNNLHGTIPPFHLKSLTYLILSSNKLSGTVKPNTLCHAIFLGILDLSNNSLSGIIPQCLGNFSKSLFVLDLRKNNFSGTIPDTFARENSLKTINLNANGFEGSIPKSLVNCRMLEALDLGNNKLFDKFPYWLENLPNLHVLSLRSNKFHGSMPTPNPKSKFSFSYLRVLDMSDNYFTGPLPMEYFKNLKAMMNVDEASFELQYLGNGGYSGKYYDDTLTITIKGSTVQMEKVLTIFTAIDLSENKFEGEIPEIVGRLNSIRGLNLSHNSLTGHIPTSLGNLSMLEWLDLSSNKLTGQIPQQLRNLLSLAVLDLSQNQLTGPIPRGNQFDTFSNDSYIGNLALCGTPLSNTCNNPRAPQPPISTFQQEEDSQLLSDFIWEVILPGYGCGLALGLVLGYLMFSTGKPQWVVRMIEGERNKSGKRLNKHAQRHRGRRN